VRPQAASLCSSRKIHTVRRPCPQRTLASTRTPSKQHTQHFTTTPTCLRDDPPSLPDITNHYTLFPTTLPAGPPPKGPFTVSLPSLRKEFLQLQSLHHPDKYPNEPAHSKALALSALINTSYKTLSDPLLRAQYLLLTKYDIDVMSEDNSSHPTDQSTLMDVMDAQEAIEEATSREEIDVLVETNAARIEGTAERMAAAFENDDAEAAKNECVRLKYWRSLQDGLKDWEPGKEVRLIH
jgi:molecular chaperone HscB